ncbi:MAG: hypothetical protein CHKLHMKO_00256 [Candidatus Argoarchaeum ethanivorans]|uniref:Periplasmic copper-binding protein NosD beta helix domain-containing protein n=1 Tax=Candidatus Argoarchaeum ethanivorans TaxID=2608793 RepID=A0A811T4V9_9EURY|nr:MAG: hypothetical protein CHKLHMKO_00256 [Candidatus Argoarchaeum ethanivorans]
MRHSSNNTITNNTANSNNDYGIHLLDADDNNITCNWVAHNTKSGFYLDDAGNMEYENTGNTIKDNNIMANGESVGDSWHWNFYNDQSDDVTAENNYWGTDSSTIIAESIYDKNDDSSKGTGDFEPFKTDPAPCAPIPELPTIILFSVGLLVLAGYVYAERRRRS